MYKRQDLYDVAEVAAAILTTPGHAYATYELVGTPPLSQTCLLYTSDAADERSSVDLGGRRIIKKKKQ